MTPGKHKVIFAFTHDVKTKGILGPSGKGGLGVLKVDGKEVAGKVIQRTHGCIVQWDAIMKKPRYLRLRKERTSNLAPAAASPAPGVQQPRGRWRWRRWLLIVGCFALGGIGMYAVAENYLVTRIPEELVGRWRVSGGDQDGVTLEFHKTGAFEARKKRGMEEGSVHARVEVGDKKLHIFSRIPGTDSEDRKTHIIHSITEKEMMLEDPEGKLNKLVRVQ